jgi:hypothetical protein
MTSGITADPSHCSCGHLNLNLHAASPIHFKGDSLTLVTVPYIEPIVSSERWDTLIIALHFPLPLRVRACLAGLSAHRTVTRASPASFLTKCSQDRQGSCSSRLVLQTASEAKGHFQGDRGLFLGMDLVSTAQGKSNRQTHRS